jgi:hypothetical protein
MADRMVDRLSLLQLRRLSVRSAASRTSAITDLSLDQFFHKVRALKDPENPDRLDQLGGALRAALGQSPGKRTMRFGGGKLPRTSSERSVGGHVSPRKKSSIATYCPSRVSEVTT